MARGENSAEVTRGSREISPSTKSLLVDDPVTCPRLGDSGVQIEEYFRYYSDNLVEYQRFERLTPGARRGDDVVQVPFPRGGSVNLPSRDISWNHRWVNVGNLVK